MTACSSALSSRSRLPRVNRGHGQARGDGHFLDDVDEPPVQGILIVAFDLRAAHHLRDLAAAARQRRRAI